MANHDPLIESLNALTGAAHVITPGGDQEPFIVDWRGRYRGHALAVVKPASTAEVAAVVQLCAAADVAVVPQGGNTGMCGAATPEEVGRTVVIRLDRMRAIRAISPLANTLTVEAGCVLADIQAAALEAGRYFPLSLGAEGSCQIGGNISTNAGGTAVLRYGPMRDLVLGLEAVLPDGRIFNGLRALRKDNTGYDLKQLFIGAEGTLGIVTAAVLKLFAPPRSRATGMVALPGPEAALDLLTLLRAAFGERLGSVEIMSRGQIEVIAATLPDVAIPFDLTQPWYLLIEATDTAAAADLRPPLEAVLEEALERGIVEDAVLASSQAQAASLWKIRHSVSEASKKTGYVVSHDSAVPLDNQALFVTSVERRILAVEPAARVVMHGHIGDGNIHVLAILDPTRMADSGERARIVAAINAVVDDETRVLGGSISAEHGIGISNRQRLARVTDPVEMELMKRIKATLDPAGTMNPGKVFLPSPSDR